jgi:hypothetical protein
MTAGKATMLFALSNLRYDTPTGNHADKRIHRTLARGERNGQANLDEEKVQEIRQFYREVPLALTADLFATTRRQIQNILA